MGPIEEIVTEGMLPKVPPPVKYKMVRNYAGGSLIERIRKCESLEALEELRNTVIILRKQRRLASGTLRKLDRVGAAKYHELRNRLIVTPPSTRLVVPGGIVSPGGIILP